jgi:hypothetical protein
MKTLLYVKNMSQALDELKEEILELPPFDQNTAKQEQNLTEAGEREVDSASCDADFAALKAADSLGCCP